MSDNNNSPPQGMQPQMMMPFPFMMPPGGWGQQDGPLLTNIAPVRVEKAMAFAIIMARSYLPVCAVDHLGNLQIETPEMSKMERAASDAACACLVDYFGGQLDSDAFEDKLLTQIEIESTRRRMGKLGPCPQCEGKKIVRVKIDRGSQEVECPVCTGFGQVLILPTQGRKD